MDTARVDICYRPLRIAWAVHSSDKESFRQVVRLNHTLWGGRFNPIVLVNHADEAKDIVDLFRADIVVGIGNSTQVREFPNQFPYLINPLLGDRLFMSQFGTGHATVLDIHNALFHWGGTAEWDTLNKQGVRRFVCEPEDPLADFILVQYGAYPDPESIGIDYGKFLSQATLWIDTKIEKNAPIPADVLHHPSFGYLTRHGMRRHYLRQRGGWDSPGYFVGDSDSIEDLACFWNLRAADIPLLFVDPAHIKRYALIMAEYEQQILEGLARLPEPLRRIAIWTRGSRIDDAVQLFDGRITSICPISELIWKGRSVQPPMMILGEASSLGVFGRERGKPRVSFALNDRAFHTDDWFYTQHLVASVSILGSDEDHSFHPPYIPEWNEFFARTMQIQYDRLRVEPERIGIIIHAAQHDSFLYGLPATALVEKLFDSIGMRAKLSNGGLIARQLISRVGGLGGARVFKIPGVRRLLRTYGLRDSFTKEAGLQLIRSRDLKNPDAWFEDHKWLFIEPRPINSELTPQMVFEYMVEKGLFRIGVELICPNCNLPSWIPLDALKQENTCELCGHQSNASRQLVNGVFHYRRTGVLGLEKNSQGAIPVILVLQQLDVNLSDFPRSSVYGPSYNLTPNPQIDLPKCEVDLVVIIPDDHRTQIILGECKDRGESLDENDIANLRRVADAFPKNRFETYIMLTKLAPFTLKEIALAQSLNGPYQRRVILLTDTELEPYHIFERTKRTDERQGYGGSPDGLAEMTSYMYFQRRSPATLLCHLLVALARAMSKMLHQRSISPH